MDGPGRVGLIRCSLGMGGSFDRPSQTMLGHRTSGTGGRSSPWRPPGNRRHTGRPAVATRVRDRCRRGGNPPVRKRRRRPRDDTGDPTEDSATIRAVWMLPPPRRRPRPYGAPRGADGGSREHHNDRAEDFDDDRTLTANGTGRTGRRAGTGRDAPRGAGRGRTAVTLTAMEPSRASAGTSARCARAAQEARHARPATDAQDKTDAAA